MGQSVATGRPRKRKEVNHQEQEIPSLRDTDVGSVDRSETVSQRLTRLRRKNTNSDQISL